MRSEQHLKDVVAYVRVLCMALLRPRRWGLIFVTVWLILIAVTPRSPLAAQSKRTGFLSSAPMSTGQDIIALAAGDFNEDTHADLALVSATSHAVVLWKGDGNGRFAPFAEQRAGDQE